VGPAVPLVLVAVVGYLLGSIPFGLLLSRLAGHGDLRRVGSGNIGATNVLRAGGKGLAALTLALDAAKGALAVALGQRWGAAAALAAGAAAVVGHVFPLWLWFRGGKGVATAFGVVIVLAWPVALAAIVVWLAVALLSRFSSLAAVAAAVAAALAAAAIAGRAQAIVVAAIAVLVVVRHRANIRRLIAGSESRISFRKG
jgi:glycerol-3-phosphate acyltransferase PlsY